MEPAQTTNIVDVYVNYLRRKLHDPAPGTLIRTVRGQGYTVPVEGEIAHSIEAIGTASTIAASAACVTTEAQ
jgi:DNA-binding winged helix-turn-helix (wHTH) protein